MSAENRKRHNTRTSGYRGTSQCLGKYAFPSKEAADASLAYNAKVVRSYRCNICRKWHMTSRPALPAYSNPSLSIPKA